LIIEGTSEKPVYLWIHDGEAEVQDAAELWGLPNETCYRALRSRHPGARVAQIGPAGERLVRYAHIVNELRHANGRTGMGAVMGSKRLKAIVVRGSGERRLADPEAFEALRKWHNQYLLESFYGKYFREHGTAVGVEYQNVMGGLPTRNFRELTFADAAGIGGQALEIGYVKGHGTCYGCVLRCKPVARRQGGEGVDPALGGPEYETLAALGSLCGVSDPAALVRANALANSLGLDTISLGACIAFAMECSEAGILDASDADGHELRFGSGEAMLALIPMIASRQGIGDLLADGVKRAAARLGAEAEALAMHVKGQELPMHDPRTKVSQALAYAVCPTGADHNTSAFDDMYAKKSAFLALAGSLGILEPVPERSLGPEKVRLYVYLHLERSLYNSLLLCQFVAPPTVPLTLPKLAEVVRAVTGWDVSEWELMKVGERGLTLARLFNIRHGLGEQDDALPRRLFEPVPAGPKAGWKIEEEELRQAIALYYGMMGWDSQGVPTASRLHELGLGEFAPT
jgi:aldehyde:ferredoxin oxidoreductase